VFIGSLGRSRIGRGGWLGRLLGSPEVASALSTVRRHGPGLVLVTRFIPFVRGPIYLATGLSGLPVRRFFLLDALAASVQVPLLLWVGSRLGRDATSQEAWTRIGWLSAGFVALGLAIVLFRRPAPAA
jgi:membrane protein DedA with SNARE-associated domain